MTDPINPVPRWTATGWTCGCCAVNWRRWRPSSPGRPPAPGTPVGVVSISSSHRTLDEFFAQHRDIVPIEVDNQAALLADLDRVTRARDYWQARAESAEAEKLASSARVTELEATDRPRWVRRTVVAQQDHSKSDHPPLQ